ncbi:ABC transporter substrate-binding protein [Mesorhizobium qingshengii]|uniref:4,5-dihydroxyphthalate decarboxylase n=1 Tax=Mesorhizobium qingshengii TaxID=1165689 RepID=A0A1G5ZA36_9HYPH|nr:ABC transporter substrate-binding protein [Mesorhizobium qingshengii]SDA91270.1 4,5-dihydroxyphthalate decarboxylase [Mesorhizobium qingshengii]
MASVAKLNVAVWRYDRTQALYDGRIPVGGREVVMIDKPLEEIFSKAFTSAEYEVSELSFSNFLRMRVDGKCSYLGIPIFPSRSFRHGAFYVGKDGPINHPRDLIGRKVGVREYSMTAALAARGGLRDQFGVEAGQMRWVVGDVNERERDTIPIPNLYKGISIEVAADGALLDDLLLAGEIDAILAYKPIKSAMEPHARSRRLFEDSEAVEKEYYAKTRVFPIMHLIGVRTADAKADATLVGDVYGAFAEAQSVASADLAYEQALKIGLPWLRQELDRTKAIMGQDYWASGFAANRQVLETMINWSFLDGLISRKIEPEELFFSEMLAT